jgi:hypothetical protein
MSITTQGLLAPQPVFRCVVVITIRRRHIELHDVHPNTSCVHHCVDVATGPQNTMAQLARPTFVQVKNHS